MRDAQQPDPVAQWNVIAQLVTETNRRVLARVEDAGIPAQWFIVLHILLASPGHRLPMSRLAAGAAMSSGGFTKLADRMGRDGLIDRRGATGDRRVVHAELTAAGVRLARKADQLYNKAVAELVVDAMGSDALRKLADAVDPLEQAVGTVEVPEVVAHDKVVPLERRRTAR